mmetsp:Transcript_11663/g.39009  ORF Transcript_11663/g.39009 Transcript_11663/m.39009 type:complete len:311 (-) Transcript_11663:160-1092(-)
MRRRMWPRRMRAHGRGALLRRRHRVAAAPFALGRRAAGGSRRAGHPRGARPRRRRVGPAGPPGGSRLVYGHARGQGPLALVQAALPRHDAHVARGAGAVGCRGHGPVDVAGLRPRRLRAHRRDGRRRGRAVPLSGDEDHHRRRHVHHRRRLQGRQGPPRRLYDPGHCGATKFARQSLAQLARRTGQAVHFRCLPLRLRRRRHARPRFEARPRDRGAAGVGALPRRRGVPRPARAVRRRPRRLRAAHGALGQRARGHVQARPRRRRHGRRRQPTPRFRARGSARHRRVRYAHAPRRPDVLVDHRHRGKDCR